MIVVKKTYLTSREALNTDSNNYNAMSLKKHLK